MVNYNAPSQGDSEKAQFYFTQKKIRRKAISLLLIFFFAALREYFLCLITRPIRSANVGRLTYTGTCILSLHQPQSLPFPGGKKAFIIIDLQMPVSHGTEH